MQTKANTPLITNQLLLELAHPDAQANMGEWDDETRALLAMAIPQMATELLHRRAALNIAVHPTAAEQRVEHARTIVRSPDPIEPRRLLSAAKTLSTHSQSASERAVARQLLHEIGAAA